MLRRATSPYQDSLMASNIRDVFKSVQRQANADIAGAKQQVVNGVRGQINNIKNSANAAVRGAVNGAVQAGVKGILGATSQALQGNLSGAVEGLVNLPNSIGNGIAGAVGRNLSGPGGFAGLFNGGWNSGGSQVMYPVGREGSNALYGIMQRADPMQSTGWYAMLPVVTSAYGTSSLPWYYVEETNVPQRQIETHSIFREGREQHFPDKYSVDSLRMGMYMDAGNVTLNYLRSWQAAVIQPTSSSNAVTQGGGYLLARNFKKPIFIFLVDVTKKAVVVYEYIECWPTNLDQLQLESASNTRLIQQVTFSVGDVFMNTLGVSEQILSGITSGVRSTVGTNLMNLASSVSSRAISGATSALGRMTSFT
ncbi:baseplate protein [Achromobacter phage Motura]|uniref:Baseplate protein n=1 Tax=Achromobacter phage Motura TaxID=2591403 RepID=A0A514CT55_9CAUD|nr:baseplate protein [Achromobacter phage Motura]QDH83644.1 baseplate protein [Achromobacter phage Motura]